MQAKDAQHFHDHHTAKGWLIGSTPMKCWKAAMRTWKRKSETFAPAGRNGRPIVTATAPAGQIPGFRLGDY